MHHSALHFALRNPGAIQNSLANFLGVQRSHVSELTAQLEQMGLIRRTPDFRNRHLNRLDITAQGIEFHRRLHEGEDETIPPAFRRWTDAELMGLYAFLKRLDEHRG
jgi:DNA-binding MarR family transcriptional regulator